MKNLVLTSVQIQKQDIFAECIKFQEDPSTNQVFIATKDSIYAFQLSEYKKIELWSWSVNGATLVDLQYMFDSEELIAIFSDGSVFAVSTTTGESATLGFVGQCQAASWNPSLSQLVVVDGDNVTFLDRMLDVISSDILSSDEHGKDALVTVGWGSKDTQFQGSIGKAAREQKNEKSLEAFEDDSHRPNISWRADGKFVLVSFYEPESKERRVKIFDGNGELMSRLKTTRSIEEEVAIKSTGNYIATTSKEPDGTRTMIFFERNGEFRHAMKMPSDFKIIGLSWDLEAAILAVVLRTEDYDLVELWTVSNYDWTRKWSQRFHKRINEWHWSSEKARTLNIVSGEQFIQLFFHETYTTYNGLAFVTSTKGIRLTDFRAATIPPPLFHEFIPSEKAIRCFSFNGRKLVLIDDEGNVCTYEENAETREITLVSTVKMNDGVAHGFISCLTQFDDDNLAFVYNGNEVIYIKSTTDHVEYLDNKLVDYPIYGIAQCVPKNTLYMATQRELVEVSPNEPYGPIGDLSLNPDFEMVFYEEERVMISGNQLSINGNIISSDVTSFTLVGRMCLYTTLQNKFRIVHISGDYKKLEEERAIEAGARIVTAIPNGTSVTMQMPRGNLETFHPRFFIISALKQLINAKQYIHALTLMKKHRIDPNFLIDYNPEEFMANQKCLFVEASNAELVNMFVTEIKNTPSEYTDTPVMTEKIGIVTCELINTIQSMSMDVQLKFFTVILTCYLRQSPPLVENALNLIKKFTDDDTQESQKNRRNWIRHIRYYVSEEDTFKAALGTYDLRLATKVAEITNKDPKEYIPILNRLRVFEPENYRNFQIDIYRKDKKSALWHISKCEEKFDEAVKFIKENNLYAEALERYELKKEYPKVVELVAAHCEFKAQWIEAAELYRRAKNTEKMLRCLELGKDVDALIRAAERCKLPEEELKKIFKRMGIHLKDSGKHREAAKAMRRAGEVTEDIVDALIKAFEWTDAVTEMYNVDGDQHEKIKELLIVTTRTRAEFLQNEARNRLETVIKLFKRLEVVRENKDRRIGAIKDGLESGRDLEEIDAFSEAGSTMSLMSRRTAKTGESRATTAASIRKRKQIEKKKQSLKEGGAYEDAAILLACHNVYGWVNETTAEVHSLLLALIDLDQIHIARRLQDCFVETTSTLQPKIVHIWPNKIQAKHLCGPILDLYIVDGVFTFPENGTMPDTILIEAEMHPPKALDCESWRVRCLM